MISQRSIHNTSLINREAGGNWSVYEQLIECKTRKLVSRRYSNERSDVSVSLIKLPE